MRFTSAQQDLTRASAPHEGCESLLLEHLPNLILAVSDLHLAAGLHSETGRFSRLENFFCDNAFGRFLEAHDPVEEGLPSLLVLNGDTFDFVRVVRSPVQGQELTEWASELRSLGLEGEKADPHWLRAKIKKRELKFGLRTDDYKTVWKLRLIAKGHEQFFEALRNWVSAGGHVLFIKGNHDLELHWPLVQKWLREEIAPESPESVHFAEECVCICNVHFQHGHGFDPVNRVRGSTELPKTAELRLPIGSFFNRYVINRLEDIEPFLDNMKPYFTLAVSLVRRHPLQSGRILWEGIRLLLRSLRLEFSLVVLLWWLFFLSLAVQVASVVLILSALAVPGVGSWAASIVPSNLARMLLLGVGLLAPWLMGFFSDIVSSLARRSYSNKLWEDRYGKGVYGLLSRMRLGYSRVYGVLGHTHTPDMQHFGSINGSQAYYSNSGSWIPNWPRDRPDLWGKTVHSFLRFDWTGTEYSHRLLEWLDEQVGAVPGKILMRRLDNAEVA